MIWKKFWKRYVAVKHAFSSPAGAFISLRLEKSILWSKFRLLNFFFKIHSKDVLWLLDMLWGPEKVSGPIYDILNASRWFLNKIEKNIFFGFFKHFLLEKASKFARKWRFGVIRDVKNPFFQKVDLKSKIWPTEFKIRLRRLGF